MLKTSKQKKINFKIDQALDTSGFANPFILLNRFWYSNHAKSLWLMVLGIVYLYLSTNHNFG